MDWPFDKEEAQRRQWETAEALGLPVEKELDLGRGARLRLVLIPAGRFIMGSRFSELWRDAESRVPETLHEVRCRNGREADAMRWAPGVEASPCVARDVCR